MKVSDPVFNFFFGGGRSYVRNFLYIILMFCVIDRRFSIQEAKPIFSLLDIQRIYAVYQSDGLWILAPVEFSFSLRFPWNVFQ